MVRFTRRSEGMRVTLRNNFSQPIVCLTLSLPIIYSCLQYTHESGHQHITMALCALVFLQTKQLVYLFYEEAQMHYHSLHTLQIHTS